MKWIFFSLSSLFCYFKYYGVFIVLAKFVWTIVGLAYSYLEWYEKYEGKNEEKKKDCEKNKMKKKMMNMKCTEKENTMKKMMKMKGTILFVFFLILCFISHGAFESITVTGFIILVFINGIKDINAEIKSIKNCKDRQKMWSNSS